MVGKMFSFLARKKTQDASRQMRRLIDLTTVNKASLFTSRRAETRQNRAIPILICPWRDDRPIVSEHLFGISKDLTDHGVGLIVNEPWTAQEVLVAFCHYEGTSGEPLFFRGTVRTLVEVGGGFWQIGLEILELFEEDIPESHSLVPLAKSLLPSESIELSLA